MSPAETVVMIGWPLLALLLANVAVPYAAAGRRVQPAPPGQPLGPGQPVGPAPKPDSTTGCGAHSTARGRRIEGASPERRREARVRAASSGRALGRDRAARVDGRPHGHTGHRGRRHGYWFAGRVERRAAAPPCDAVTGAIPELIDLIRLALDSGCTIPLAFNAIAGRYQGPLAGDLAVVARDLAEGQGTANALEGLLARVGEPVRPLCAALLAGERYGLPTAAMLDALAIEARATRRRYDEQRARRLPITMLFPLITCTLPAFALLTVVPLLASGLQAVRW